MSKKILVVDDEQSIVTLLQYNLEQAGYSVMRLWMENKGYRLLWTYAPI